MDKEVNKLGVPISKLRKDVRLTKRFHERVLTEIERSQETSLQGGKVGQVVNQPQGKWVGGVSASWTWTH